MHDAEAIFLCFFNVSPGPKLIRASYAVYQNPESFVGLRIPARPATPKTSICPWVGNVKTLFRFYPQIEN